MHSGEISLTYPVTMIVMKVLLIHVHFFGVGGLCSVYGDLYGLITSVVEEIIDFSTVDYSSFCDFCSIMITRPCNVYPLTPHYS